MKKVYMLLFLFLGTTNLMALDSLIYKLMIEEDEGSSLKNLRFGLHSQATFGVDTSLGENKLPELLPPDGLYSVMLITDSSDNNATYWSYYDLRPMGVEKFVRYYRFKIYNIISPFTLSWDEMGAYVDSAFLQDVFTGDIVKVDMKSNTEYHIDNISLNQYNIVVFFNLEPIGIEEIDVEQNISVIPNPSQDYIQLINVRDIDGLVIYNSFGIKVFEGNPRSQMIVDISNLNDGVYFIRFDLGDGLWKVIKFVKA